MFQQQSRKGDKTPFLSFEEIVKMYSERVFNLIYSKIQDYDEALDLTQDVFYYAFKGYKSFRGDADIFTWLYRIAVNRTNRYLKKKKMIYLEELPDVVSEDTPEKFLINEEMKEKLRFAIERLHPQHREVIYLRYYEELDYDKISEILGIPIGTVKSRIARAKEEIMKNIGEL